MKLLVLLSAFIPVCLFGGASKDEQRALLTKGKNGAAMAPIAE
jgi:hypothetical protein